MKKQTIDKPKHDFNSDPKNILFSLFFTSKNFDELYNYFNNYVKDKTKSDQLNLLIYLNSRLNFSFKNTWICSRIDFYLKNHKYSKLKHNDLQKLILYILFYNLDIQDRYIRTARYEERDDTKKDVLLSYFRDYFKIGKREYNDYYSLLIKLMEKDKSIGIMLRNNFALNKKECKILEIDFEKKEVKPKQKFVSLASFIKK